MNELDCLKDLGREVPLPSNDELAPARARLVVAMNTQPSAGRPRRRRLRPLLVGGLSGGLAAAVVVAVVFVLVAGQPDRQPLGAPTGEPPASSEPAIEAPKTVTAATVLRAASAAAIAQPFVVPRPDQFLYLETRGAGVTRRDWLSMDGTHDSLIAQTDSHPGDVIGGCRNGQREVGRQGGPVIVQEPCEPEPAYLPDAPTDAQAMLAYVQGLGGTPGTNSYAKNVLFLAGWNYLRPQARAALYEAAALIEGVDIVPDVVDGAGRPGVGVGWSYGGRTVMVFDPNTHALLGFENGEAIITATVVDAAGQLP